MAKGKRSNKNFTAEGFEAVQNEEYYKAMQEKRRSSAAGTMDSRPNRQRTRKTQKQNAISYGW